MLCYKDRTFCVSPKCRNECGRKLTIQVEADARRWWGPGKGEPPISQSYFCDENGNVIKSED